MGNKKRLSIFKIINLFKKISTYMWSGNDYERRFVNINKIFILQVFYFSLDSLNQSSAPMIIGITVTTMFLVLIIIILTGILCFRWRKNRLSSKGNKTNKCKCKKRKEI